MFKETKEGQTYFCKACEGMDNVHTCGKNTLEEEFWLLWGLAPKGSLKEKKGKDVLDFIKQREAKLKKEYSKTHVRIHDVSEWQEFGKIKGYYDFCYDMALRKEKKKLKEKHKQELKELLNRVIKEIEKGKYSEMDSSMDDYYKGHNVSADNSIYILKKLK